MKKLNLIFLIVIISVSACKKEITEKYEGSKNGANSNLVLVDNMNNIKVPIGFKWETSRDVSVKINTNDTRFLGAIHKVMLYHGDPAIGGYKVAEGSVTITTAFNATLNLANFINELYLIKVAPDQTKIIEKIVINNNAVVTVISFAEPVKLLKSGGGPDCLTGCTQTITTSNTNLIINTGDVVCVTGNNIIIGFNASGGTIRICGSNIIVANANLNNFSTLIISSTGSASFGNLNINGAATNFQNYGIATINNTFSPVGSVTNHGTLNTRGDYNLNSQAVQLNNGILNVGESMNIGGYSNLTNNGSITTGKDFKINDQGIFINNCKLWVKGEFQNSKTTKNYGYMVCDQESKINGGSELEMYNTAMFKSGSIIINGTIKGLGSTSLVKIAGETKINSGGEVTNAIQFCDENGIETNNGRIGNGAISECGLYVPISACNPLGNGYAPMADADGDGVADASDCYPNDAGKAFCNPYATSTIVFEDLWPLKGDYDMNDVVINYSYNIISNALNNVVRVEATYVLRSTGGSFNNAFAVQFPVNRSLVSGVSGATLETGQTKAVLVIFNNMRTEMNYWNTVPSKPSSSTITYNVGFNISNGLPLATFGLSSYNPFIWNGTAGFGRGYETHLPGKLPTDLADKSLFGTNADGSNLSTGDTYLSKNGRFPWAINIPLSFSYPKEKADINIAYTRFASWASSGGTQYIDWYTNKSGFRNLVNIY
ncbi:MAG: LruC domain-containing protein [Bacteroidia bacterium]|nr:LruC domain-containing protein [Bacteroidia bacterium]